jgi:hypothetical protein
MSEHKDDPMNILMTQEVHPMLLDASAKIHLPLPLWLPCLQYVATQEYLKCIFMGFDFREIV